MRKVFLFIVFLILAVFLFQKADAAYPPAWKWKTIRSEHFTIYYPVGYEAVAQRIYNLTDEVYKDVTGYLKVKPPKCPIVINPGTDIFNGFFSPFPNRISLYEAPPYYVRGFGPASDIEDLVFTHEFTHFVHLTMASGWYRNISTILGSGTRITNILSPGWIIEGVTTNTETLFTDGGRGRCSWFRGKFLSCTEGEGLWGLSEAGIYSPYSPPGSRYYLAGYHMVRYLNRHYGKDAFTRLSHYQAAHPIGGATAALRSVTGKSPGQFYREFKSFTENEAKIMKSKASASGLPGGRVLFADPLETISSCFWTESGNIMALRSGYGKKNALIEIEAVEGTQVDEIKTGIFTAISPVRKLEQDVGKILTVAVFPHPLGEGELLATDIAIFDKEKRKTIRYTKNSHLFSADLSPDGSLFVAARRNGMWIDLVLVEKESKKIRTLISEKGLYFEEPRWSPDGSLITAVLKSGRNADIVLVDPESGKITPIYSPDPFEESDPVFSPDGKWLLFSSNRSGTWNIFGWDLNEKRLYQLTSVNYGASMPSLSPDGKTLAFLSLHGGVNTLCVTEFNPCKNGKIISVGQKSQIAEPDLKRLNPKTGFTPKCFLSLKAYEPFLHIPYLQSDDDSLTLGLWFLGADPVGINSYSASIYQTTVTDITPAYEHDSDKAENFWCYDITLSNRSFWPLLQIRFRDDIKNGSILWYREKMVETGAGITIINRVMPSVITSSLFAGYRYRHRTSKTPLVHFYSDGNDSTSVFGELTLSRSPDYPARNIIPTRGQLLVATHEKGLEKLGGEVDSENTLVSLSQYLPSFFNNHGLKLRGAFQTQRGLLYSKDLSLPRGYSEDDEEGGMNLENNILLSGEYHFPLAYPDKGLGMTLFHIHALKSSVFFDWGAGWKNHYDYSRIRNIARKTAGATLTCQAGIFSLFSFETGIEAGYKIEDEESYVSFLFTGGF